MSKFSIRIHFLMIGFFTICMLALASCSTFEAVKEAVGLEQTTPDGDKVVKFSESNQYPHITQRKYEHMNKSRMEDESDLGSNAGSMWKMDGQGAYLFTQNKMRKEGDFLNIKLDGSAQKQVDMKVETIKKLLKELETLEKRNSLAREPAAAGAPAVAAATPAAPAAGDGTAKADEKADQVQIGPVPSKIIERLADGTLRVRGQQPFMVNNREFKVLVAGILRAEDFSDEMVSSDKLLDSEVDVVSLRKKDQGK